MQSNTWTFVLTTASTTGSENAAALVAAIPQILSFVGKFTPPILAQITGSGVVSLLLNHQGMIDRYDRLPP